VGALAAVLRRLADDPSLRARLGAAGRRRASDFAPDAIGEAMGRIYRSLAPVRS
jgi:hypothetical protein